MTLPYDRSFKVGRQSELLYNEELHKNFESTRHLLDAPPGKNAVPEAKLDGSLWLDRKKNELNSYHQASNTWKNIFSQKFQIVDQITNQLPPDSPVIGQLWLYNDVLMYYDGAKWKPIKALEQDGSQFNLSVFENFTLISPLWKIGNTIIKDEAIAAYEDREKKYIQGKIDAIDNADTIADGTSWRSGHICKTSEVTIGDLHLEGKAQLLVPNIDVDRIFVDDKIDFNYEAPTKVCIEYPKEYLADKTPSLVHVNPGKLTKVKKRLVAIDRANPKIGISAANTEFYGFRKDSIFGKFLLPKDIKETAPKDYEILSDGIYLSYDASQNFDYVLAVTYEFSWFKSTGNMAYVNSSNKKSSYYIQDYQGPLSVFVDGMNLEEPYYEEDNMSQVIDIKEDTAKMDVSVMHTAKREYGFVREIDIHNRAVIKVLRHYKNPLIFMNGEAMHPAHGGIEIIGNMIYVNGGQRNMAWSVIDLWDEINSYDMEIDSSSYGVVTADATGRAFIKYDTAKVFSSDDLVLFIDGLLIKKEDIVRDKAAGKITVEGLKAGQEYIILQDKYHNLYDETKIMPALPVGNVSESLVYMNGYLLCNDTAVVSDCKESDVKGMATNGEVKLFLADKSNLSSGVLKIYDELKEIWIDASPEIIREVNSFAFSYRNTVKAIKFNIETTKTDAIDIYAFNYANAIGHSLVIRNFPSQWYNELDKESLLLSDTQKALNSTTDPAKQKSLQAEINSISAHIVDLQKNIQDLASKSGKTVFEINEGFTQNNGSLSVWVNGVRQYYVDEAPANVKYGFALPQPVNGLVTYVIEEQEKGASKVAEREYLTYKNIVPNTINVYRTTKPLYPGRVLIYINGVRQPQSAFTILDNYTIIFNDEKTMLIGNANNFPTEIITTPETAEEKNLRIELEAAEKKYEKADKASEKLKLQTEIEEISKKILQFQGDRKKLLQHKKADVILVEVKQDYDRRENYIQLDKSTNYDIVVNHYGLPIDILEASDEIMIFVDGLFYGLREYIGYRKDKNKGVITLMDSDVVQKIISDPLATFLKGNPAAMLAYKNTHNQQEYEPKTKDMIFDWR